jgi:hypothetical protein
MNTFKATISMIAPILLITSSAFEEGICSNAGAATSLALLFALSVVVFVMFFVSCL